MDLVILDFSKAFDRVQHQRLLEKLNHSGIRGQTHGWNKSFILGRTQQVIIDGATSESPVINGVTQDTVLGPLLFLLFINDLPDCVTPRTRIFADDCIVYQNIQTPKDNSVLDFLKRNILINSNPLEKAATVPRKDENLQVQLLSEDHTCVELTTSLSC